MDQDFYISLIHQDLQGTLLEDGQRQLAQWRQADLGNPDLERQVRKSWELSQRYAPELAVDTAAAFNNLRTRVRAHEKAETATVRKLPAARSSRNSWLAVAASLLLLLAAGWFLYPSFQSAGPMASLETKIGDAPKEVVLADGTKVWLRENSRLEYPEQFAGKDRRVALSGEAFFDVAENPESPFRIALPAGAEVEVLGTSFLVRAQPDSLVAVNVSTGKVALNAGNKVLILPQGKAGSWDPATGQVAELNHQPNAGAWRNNTLFFDDQPLAEVARELESFFNVTLTFGSTQPLSCRFSGRFPAAKLPEILAAMQQTIGVTWIEADGEYQLDDGNCE